METVISPLLDLDGVQSEEFLEIDEWRERTLVRVLKVVLVLAVLASFPYTYFAVMRGVTIATFLNAGGIALLSIALFRPSLPYQVRALCLVMIPYANGTATLFVYGTLTFLYLVAFPIVTVIFLGSRYAIAAIALATATLLVGGQFTTWQPVLAGIASDKPLVRWGVLAFNYACISGALTLACAILLGKVEMSLKTQKLAAHSVELRQQEITRLKREIETMKQWTGESTTPEVAAKEFSNPFM